MKRKRLQIDINEILNKSYIDKENKNNIIIISHSKNKSADLKYNFKTDLIINNTRLKNSSKKKKNNKNLIKNDKRNNNLLIKNNSVASLLNSNKSKKKYFFDPNFFNRGNSKKKLNISFKKNLTNKKEKYPLSENSANNNIIDNLDTQKRKRRIIKIKSNRNVQDNALYIKNKNKNGINNINIHGILYDNKKEGNKNKKNKTNLIYIKSKISGIPYRNKRCPTSRLNLSQKSDNIKLNCINSKQDINDKNNILEDSLDSHNTLVDENNINEYKYFSNNLSFQELIKNEDKFYQKVKLRKKNILADSLINKYKKKLPRSLTKENKINNNYTPKTSRFNNEKYHCSYGMNINNNFVYKKVNTQRLSTSFNKNINFLLSSSLSSTRNQTNKYKDNLENIIVNKDVTEFIYSDDLLDDFSHKKVSIKNWLTNLGLISYSQNFYSKNIFEINALINDIKIIKQSNILFDYFEKNYQIHLPGHIFRILIKLEIEEGNIDSDIADFFIKKEKNTNKLNKLTPSILLNLYDNCDKLIDYPSISKNNLKLFLRKYHLIHLYHNFYQNGFDLINFVILQMYSKNYAINDNILENCFHIYNKNERNLVLKSLIIEKSNIDLFLNSNKYKENKRFGLTENLDMINLNDFNTYNNFDLYFNAKEIEENDCKICLIF